MRPCPDASRYVICLALSGLCKVAPLEKTSRRDDRSHRNRTSENSCFVEVCAYHLRFFQAKKSKWFQGCECLWRGGLLTTPFLLPAELWGGGDTLPCHLAASCPPMCSPWLLTLVLLWEKAVAVADRTAMLRVAQDSGGRAHSLAMLLPVCWHSEPQGNVLCGSFLSQSRRFFDCN